VVSVGASAFIGFFTIVSGWAAIISVILRINKSKSDLPKEYQMDKRRKSFITLVGNLWVIIDSDASTDMGMDNLGILIRSIFVDIILSFIIHRFSHPFYPNHVFFVGSSKA